MMPRLNGKQDLTKIQLQERIKRSRRRRHWLTQRPGTKPTEFQPCHPVFIPIPRVSIGSILGELLKGNKIR